ncbi:response regulator [Dokdonia ponticola]|uniref:Response regulator n=1 Tax=Dokdonia ponticola TaxID=2041041 RepID=A0ABV9I330_9FLAO
MKKKDGISSQQKATYSSIEHNLKELKVLIIEDHPLMQVAISDVFAQLSNSQQQYYFQIEVASNCQEAYEKLSSTSNTYDLIMLDIQLPAYPSQKLYSGEDIGLWIKKTLPVLPKIIIITVIEDNFRVENIIKTINPDGFLLKGDITPETLMEALKKIFDATPYYSESVTKYTRKLMSNSLLLDETDRQILYELSQGASNIELQELLSLSKSTIQKRKGRLMDIFNIADNSTRVLILKAKEQGFL